MKRADLMLVMCAASMAGCEPAAGPAKAAPLASIKPEMLVHWEGNSDVYCKTQDALAEFMGHSQRSEQTKALAMLDAEGPCRIQNLPHATGKVLSLALLVNGTRAAEVVPAGSGLSAGFWTPEDELRPGIAP